MNNRLLIVMLILYLPMLCFSENKDTIIKQSERPGLLTRIIDYFSQTNQPDTTKSLDISFLGGPYYTNETKLGIGMVAAGIYRGPAGNSISDGGQINLYGDISLTGYYKLGIDGVHNLKNSWKLIYDISFESAPDKYWGIGYDMGCQDRNEIKYKRWNTRFDCSFLHSFLLDRIFIGPHLLLDYLDARDIADNNLWRGQKLHTFTNSIGFKIEYDTRDSRFNAHEGVYFCVDQLFAPRFVGNDYAFSSTEITVSGYYGVWSGGVLAANFHTRLTYGNTPWGLMSKLGGNYVMRGYWEGRYNDKCAVDATVELRQKIYKRHGMVLWIGTGEVFPNLHSIFRGHLLPDAGVGYRWEFKKGVNVRVDYGFGRHQQGLIFNLNEAF